MRISFDPSGQARGPAARIAATVLGVIAFGATMMFSVVIFAGLALAGLTLWAYFRWKTRALRRTMREGRRAQGFGMSPDELRGRAYDADVIEGEAVRVENAEEKPADISHGREDSRPLPCQGGEIRDALH